MLFKLSMVGHDTCGSEWTIENTTEYIEANTLFDVWVYLKRPQVIAYRLKGSNKYSNDVRKSIPHPDHGYGIWIDNPNFNFEPNLSIGKIDWFESLCDKGFVSQMVRTIHKVKKYKDLTMKDIRDPSKHEWVIVKCKHIKIRRNSGNGWLGVKRYECPYQDNDKAIKCKIFPEPFIKYSHNGVRLIKSCSEMKIDWVMYLINKEHLIYIRDAD